MIDWKWVCPECGNEKTFYITWKGAEPDQCKCAQCSHIANEEDFVVEFEAEEENE